MIVSKVSALAGSMTPREWWQLVILPLLQLVILPLFVVLVRSARGVSSELAAVRSSAEKEFRGLRERLVRVETTLALVVRSGGEDG